MATKLHNPVGVGLLFDDTMLHVDLADGRRISVPLEWFPRLRDATPEQRSNWRWIGGGIGIHWNDLDEDISIAGLLGTSGASSRRPDAHFLAMDT